jgi:(E)-4-hydroxy-3-methylbut-2-enyl-diphosphate synthase
MLELAEKEIELLSSSGFDDIVVSLKAREIPVLIESNVIFSETYDYPLHIGVTESGFGLSGSVLSAVGIGAVLSRGIGDTIRVSLTGDPETEIPVCKLILRSLGLRQFAGVDITCCPTCGRTRIDVQTIAKRVEEELKDVKTSVKVAVMGCEVNGPGEAREADVGIAGGKDFGILFVKGNPVKKVFGVDALVDALVQEVKKNDIQKDDSNEL